MIYELTTTLSTVETTTAYTPVFIDLAMFSFCLSVDFVPFSEG